MLGCFPLVKYINIIKRTEESTEAMAAAAKTGIWPPNIKNNHNQSVTTSQAFFFFSLKQTGRCWRSPHTNSKYKFVGQIQNITRWALPSTSESEVGDFWMSLECIAYHTEDCSAASVMGGGGAKGGIWYAEDGVEDLNYLTQLVLHTGRGKKERTKDNYFRAERLSRWFTFQNAKKKWLIMEKCGKYAEQARALTAPSTLH